MSLLNQFRVDPLGTAMAVAEHERNQRLLAENMIMKQQQQHEMLREHHLLSSSRTWDYDVIVVGAGIAGCYAVHRIAQKCPSARVLLLEASQRLGGRVASKSLASDGGAVLECGFDGYASHHARLRNLIAEIGLAEKESPLVTNSLFSEDGQLVTSESCARHPCWHQ